MLGGGRLWYLDLVAVDRAFTVELLADSVQIGSALVSQGAEFFDNRALICELSLRSLQRLSELRLASVHYACED